MIVRRSKSSAILPLRKHLIEKSLNEQKLKAMDEEQFYYQQKQIARERVLIRPIEEVMEEDVSKYGGEGGAGEDTMDTESSAASAHHHHHHHHHQSDGHHNRFQQSHPPPHLLRQTHSFTARLGPSGLSPLVLSEVSGSPTAISNDYVTKLLPRQPLDLAMSSSGAATGAQAAYAVDLEQLGSGTGLGYDPAMLSHECVCKNALSHPEHPGRILTIWNRLVATRLAEQCVRVSRKATLEEIQSCHSELHTLVYGTDMVNRCSLTGSQELNRDNRMGKFCSLECGGTGVDADTYWNELETPGATRTAVGCVIELAQKV